MQILITVCSNNGVQSSAARALGVELVRQLQARPMSPTSTRRDRVAAGRAALISKDGETGVIVAGITGGESGARKHAETLSNELVHDGDAV